MKLSTRLQFPAYLLLGSLMMLMPAFYNLYPITYSDSGTYILSSKTLIPPNDRPIGYGLFIHYTGQGLSLWIPVFVQALLLVYLLHRLGQIFFKDKFTYRHGLLTLLGLCACSAAAQHASYLLPDIFAALMILATAVYLLRTKHSWFESGILLLLVFIACISHYSHLVIATLLMSALWLYKGLYRASSLKLARLGILTFMLVTSCSFLLLYNYNNWKEWKLSRSSSLFLVAHLGESGLLHHFLDKKCPSANYSLCQCKDSIPTIASEFLWTPKSCLNKTYAFEDWPKADQEYAQLLRDIFSDPYYLCWFLGESAKSSLKQFSLIKGIHYPVAQGADSPCAYVLTLVYTHERIEFMNSLQNRNAYSLTLGLDFHVYAVYISVLLVTLAWGRLGMVTLQKKIVLFLVLGIFLNATVTASLANIVDRLQSRVSWMFVWVGISMLFLMYQHFVPKIRKLL